MARTFDVTTGQRIQIPSGFGWTAGQDLFLGCWFRAATWTTGTMADPRFFAKGTGTNSGDHVVMLGMSGSVGGPIALRSRIKCSNGAVTTHVGATDIAATIAAGAWFYAWVTVADSGGVVNVGYNNTTDHTGALNSGVGLITDTTTGTVIGNSHDDAGALRAPDGDLAWITAATRIPNANELAALVAGFRPTRIFRPSELLGLWPLWGNHSPEIDYSPNGRSGTIQGTIPKSATNPPMRVHVRTQYPLIEEAGGGGFQAAWARGSNHLIGAGVCA